MLNQDKIIVSGIPTPSSQTFVAHELIKGPLKQRSAVLWLVKNTVIKQKYLRLLEYWEQHQPTPHVCVDIQDTNTWALACANNIPVIVLATYTETAEPITLTPPNDAAHTAIKLESGEIFSLYALRRMLLTYDLFENTLVSEPNTFAVRGELLDVWLPGFQQPLRVTFDNKTIESIQYIDPVTNTVQQDVSSVVLPRTQTSNVDTWLAYFSLLITLDEEAEQLPKQFSKTIPKHITFSALSQQNTIDLGGQSMGSISHNHIQAQIQKYTITNILTTYSKLALDNTDIQHIEPFVYLDSWILPGIHLALLADTKAKSRTTSKRKQQVFTSTITTGDFVVHQDHGIGRYAGMVTQTVDDIKAEYLLLNYAGGDKLYVPPYQINKLTLYVGEPKPKLNKLSGSTWLATVKKIREETIHTAHDIIQLSAKRQLIQIEPMKHHPKETALAADFPFTLTKDQEAAWHEIEADLASTTPMDRLLCGDVGFGKTELALRAAFKTVLSGGQVAILAPTTILVQQHYDLFKDRLEPFGVSVGLLSRWQTKTEQEKTVAQLKEQECSVVIGTHRLLSQDVHIPNLHLLIIDEEQKFGVKHKEALLKQRSTTHTLLLSATPIPRTLNYSLSGLKDISVIQTPPPGRLPITTQIIPYDEHTLTEAITSEMSRGGQIYYLIRKVQEIPGVLAKLKKLIPSATIERAHGQLPPKELADIMTRFDHNEIDVLVCSTIIENGLDLPNANTLIVDNAAHFGLSQLYQLRGRIGRSTKQGFAYLFFHRQKLSGIAAERLQALQGAYELGSGFDIAMRDLEIRGAGNLLGKEQHGQIAAVGLGLYNQLLEETIESLTADGVSAPELDVTIDVPIAATLVDTNITNEVERLHIYQALAHAHSEEELEKEAKEMLPDELDQHMENMMLVLRIKLLCQRLRIYAIDSRTLSHNPFDAKLYVHFSPDAHTNTIPTLIDHNDNWVFDGQQLKIKTSQLSQDDWLNELYNNLRLLKG